MENEDDKIVEELVKQVCSRCYITDTDELIKDRLLSIIKNAISSVKSLIGISDEENFNFSKVGKENELFINYCMYRWNNKTQKEFELNYIGDIISLRSEYEVKYFKKKSDEVENG